MELYWPNQLIGSQFLLNLVPNGILFISLLLVTKCLDGEFNLQNHNAPQRVFLT